MRSYSLLARVCLLGLVFMGIAAPGSGGGGGLAASGGGGGSATRGFSLSAEDLRTPRFWFAVFGLVGGAAGVVFAFGALKRRRLDEELIELIVATKAGATVSSEVDRAMLRANFLYGRGRAATLQRVAVALQDHLAGGWVRSVNLGSDTAADVAPKLFQNRMQQIRTRPIPRWRLRKLTSLRVTSEPDDGCLVGLIYAVRKDRSVKSKAAVVLEGLANGELLSASAAYVYYLPDPGLGLTVAQALRGLEELKAHRD
jgi:hypothetical protein